MILRYENTIEDFIEFNLYMYDHIPSIRRERNQAVWGVAVALLLFFSLLACSNDTPEERRGGLYLGLLLVLLWLLLVPRFMRHSVGSQVRKTLGGESATGLIGSHELELTADGLIERTDFTESIAWWHGIEKVVSHEGYTFIYLNPVMAYVVPREAVSSGDYHRFVEAVKDHLAQRHFDRDPERGSEGPAGI